MKKLLKHFVTAYALICLTACAMQSREEAPVQTSLPQETAEPAETAVPETLEISFHDSNGQFEERSLHADDPEILGMFHQLLDVFRTPDAKDILRMEAGFEAMPDVWFGCGDDWFSAEYMATAVWYGPEGSKPVEDVWYIESGENYCLLPAESETGGLLQNLIEKTKDRP